MPEFKLPDNPLSNSDLEKSYWITTHKLLFKKIFIALLIALDLFLILSSSYNLINYYTVELKEYQQVMGNFALETIDFAGIKEANKPLKLIVEEVKILENGKNLGEDTYDLVAKIYNPNKQLKSSFSYKFYYGTTELAEHSNFILPEEVKYVADYGEIFEKKQKEARFLITSSGFKRISTHEIENPGKFVKNRINFITDNVKFNEIETQNDYYKITFDLINKTIYNYWEMGLTTLIYNNSELIGINYITLKQFKSGEAKPIDINWYKNLPASIKISTIPEIDVFDKDIYMDFQGNQTGLIP